MFFFRFTLIFLVTLYTFINAEDINNNSSNARRWNFSRRYRTSTTSSTTTKNLIKAIEENNNHYFFTSTTELPIINFETTIKILHENNITENCGNLIGENIPWIAIIEHKDPDNSNSRKTLSKGVLISDKHVLTTVSSIHHSHPFWIVSGIRLGDPSTYLKSNSNNNTASKPLTIGIDKIYQHEDKDIAIIRMIENANFTDTIQPICLTPGENYNFRESYTHLCKKAMGNTGIKKYSELIPVYTLTPQDCVIMYSKKGAKISDQEFCAWDQYGDDCAADIGGPLMAKYSGKYFVVGLNSYAIIDDDADITDYPGVYVNVGSHLQWIKKIIEEK